MEGKEKVCLHNFDLLSPPESSTSASSGILSSAISSINNRPLLKCKKCKKIFTTGKNSNNLFEVDIINNHVVMINTPPDKTTFRKKTTIDESPHEYMKRKGEELGRVLNIPKNSKIVVIALYDRIKGTMFCDIYIQYKSFFGYRTNEWSSIPPDSTRIARIKGKTERDEYIDGFHQKSGKKWLDEIRVYTNNYLETITEFGMKNNCRMIVDETGITLDE